MATRTALFATIGLGLLLGTLYIGSSDHAGAAFPGYNGDIVYTVYCCSESDEDYEIYVASGTGRNPRNISNSPDFDEISATWSPDGTKIAFASDRGGSLDVYVMDPDGSNVVQLTDDPGLDCCAEWSPDGSKLVFHSDRDGDFDIYSMNIDGSDVTQLTDIPTFDLYAAYSPDGTRIVFTSTRANLESEAIFLMDPDGSNVVQLTEGIGETEPNWSPDGSQIVYQGWDEDAESYELRVMNADGSGQRDVFPGAFVEGVNPVWSPDGTKILFDDDGELHTVSPDGTDRELLLSGPDIDFNADWQAISSPATPEPPEPTATRTPRATATPEETVVDDAPTTTQTGGMPGLPPTGSGPDDGRGTFGWLLAGLAAGGAAAAGTLVARRR